MNEIINTTGGAPATMTTVEIAELCEKRHDHVMRDTKVMLEALKIDLPKFGGIYRDDRNREQKCFNLPRDLTMTLITGYSIPLRKRVIDRLDEYERGARPAAIDFSDPALLLGVVSHLQSQVGEQAEMIAEQGQRLTKLDRIEGAAGNITVTEAAKVLKVKPGFLRKFLHENRWIYKRPNAGNWLAYQSFMPKYLDHRDHTYKDDEGEVHFTTYAVITPAGVVKLAAMLEEHFSSTGEAA